MAIQEEMQAFITRLPEVTHLKFKGGYAFLSEAGQGWAASKQGHDSDHVHEHAWHEIREKMLLLAAENGLATALQHLNAGLNQAVEPREKFYWRLLTAEVMDNHQCSALARLEYQTLLSQFENLRIQEWEPSLLQRLKQLVDAE